MSLHTIKNTLPLFSVLLFSSISYANITPYLGVTTGFQFAQDKSYDSHPSNTPISIYGGLQFDKNWRLDLGYQYWTPFEAKDNQVNIDTNMVFESALRYDYYINPSFSVYGRIGASFWDITKQPSDVSDNGFSSLREVGLGYTLSDSWSAHLGYKYIDEVGSNTTGRFDIQSVVIGMTYHFIQEDKRNEKTITATTQPVKSNVLTLSSSNLNINMFKLNQSTLSEQTKAALDQLILKLKENPTNIVITGYTDNSGTKTYNEKISTQSTSG